MGIKSYYELSKKDINRELEKYLSKNQIDQEFNNIDYSKLSELVYTREQAESILLKKSDRESFLNELKRRIKPQVLDNMAKRLDGRTREDIEEERKRQIEKYAKNMQNPEDIDIEDFEDKKSDESKEESEDKDINTIRSEVLKSVYKAALIEYYKLVSDLQVGYNGEVSRGSSDNGTKMNTKLIMYQNYLRKLDMWYGNINGGAHIAYDEEIADLVNREENKKLNNELIVNKKKESRLNKIEELNDKLDEISKKMIDISNIDDNSISKIEELRELSKEYSDIKYELANIKPSIGILYAEEQEASKNEDFKYRLGLLVYQKRTDRKVLDSKNKSKLKRDLVEDKNSTERIENATHNVIKTNLQKAEKALEDFDNAIDEGRINDALQSLKVANELSHSTSEVVENIDENGNKIEEIKIKISENDENNRQKELNNKLGIGSIYTKDEILANDLKSIRNNIKSDIDKNKSYIDRDDSKIDNSRVR